MKAIILAKSKQDLDYVLRHLQVDCTKASEHANNDTVPSVPESKGLLARVCNKFKIPISDVSLKWDSEDWKFGRVVPIYIHYTGSNPNIFFNLTNMILSGMYFQDGILNRLMSYKISYN